MVWKVAVYNTVHKMLTNPSLGMIFHPESVGRADHRGSGLAQGIEPQYRFMYYVRSRHLSFAKTRPCTTG